MRREKQWRQGILKLVETAGGKRLAMKRRPGDFVQGDVTLRSVSRLEQGIPDPHRSRNAINDES